MPNSHGTYDDSQVEKIKSAVEDALAQYQYRRLVEIIVQTDVSLAIAAALEEERDQE